MSDATDANGHAQIDDRKPWMCKAHLRDGSGRLCRKPALAGQRVCGSHGGFAPQNLQAAKQRLLEAADPIAARLVATALDDADVCPTCGRSADPAIALRAQIATLDRAGLGPRAELEVVPPATEPPQDDLVPWLTTGELHAMMQFLDDARERRDRGELPGAMLEFGSDDALVLEPSESEGARFPSGMRDGEEDGRE